DRQHLRILADDGIEVVARPQLLRQVTDPLVQPPPFEGVAGRQRDEIREARHQPRRLLGEDAPRLASVQIDHAEGLAAVFDGVADHRQDQQAHDARPVADGRIVEDVGMPEREPLGAYFPQDRAADLELRPLDVLPLEVARPLEDDVVVPVPAIHLGAGRLAGRTGIEQQDHPPLRTAQTDDTIDGGGQHPVEVPLRENRLTKLQQTPLQGFLRSYGISTPGNYGDYTLIGGPARHQIVTRFWTKPG